MKGIMTIVAIVAIVGVVATGVVVYNNKKNS